MNIFLGFKTFLINIELYIIYNSFFNNIVHEITTIFI